MSASLLLIYFRNDIFANLQLRNEINSQTGMPWSKERSASSNKATVAYQAMFVK